MLYDGPAVKRLAGNFDRQVIAAYAVNYFNRTRSNVAINDGVMQRDFATWTGAVNDANSIGIYRYSLGGFLAVATGTLNDHVGAEVEQSGGVWSTTPGSRDTCDWRCGGCRARILRRAWISASTGPRFAEPISR